MLIFVYSNSWTDRKGVVHCFSVGLHLSIFFGATIADQNNEKGSRATNTRISSTFMCKERGVSNNIQANMDDLIKKHVWYDSQTWRSKQIKWERAHVSSNYIVNLTTWSTDTKDITLESPVAFKEMHLAVEGVKQGVETSENGAYSDSAILSWKDGRRDLVSDKFPQHGANKQHQQ